MNAKFSHTFLHVALGALPHTHCTHCANCGHIVASLTLSFGQRQFTRSIHSELNSPVPGRQSSFVVAWPVALNRGGVTSALATVVTFKTSVNGES